MTVPWRSFAHLAGLWALVVVQPLVDVLGRAPEFFVAHRADAVDAIALALGLALIGPIVLGLVVLAAAMLGRRCADGVTAALVGALGGIAATQVAYRLGAGTWTAAAAVGALALVAAAAAWIRLPRFRSFLTALSPAALVVPVVFLVSGPLRPAAVRADTETGTSMPRRATPIVVIVFDELSLVSLMDDVGRINAARFPHFAALAADGVWLRSATAVSDYTRWALPAILTGRYPSPDSTPTPADHPNTLFSLVGRSHRLEVFEPVTAICPRDLCTGSETPRLERWSGLTSDLEVVAAHVFLPPSARAGLPSLTENWAGFVDEETAGVDDPAPAVGGTPRWRRIWRRAAGTDHLATATAFIDGIAADDAQPTLYFMHTLASHHPSRWLPTGQRIANRRGIPGVRGGLFDGTPWLVAQHHHAALVQAGLADWLVGRLRARLKDAGLYDDALVVVTADHGVSFRPGGRMRAFTGDNLGDIAPVPFIVKPPAWLGSPAPGTIDDSNVETIDVLPTVAAVLNVGVRWPMDGRSVLDSGAGRPEKRFYFDGAARHTARPTGELSRLRDEAVARQSMLFGSARWPVFTLTEARPFIGREVGSFGSVVEDRSVRVAIDHDEELQSVDVEAAELPAQLTGRVRDPGRAAAAGLRLAVALNGVIVATTRTWPGQAQWAAMLPPESLRPGPNTVELFVVTPARPDELRRPRQ